MLYRLAIGLALLATICAEPIHAEVEKVRETRTHYRITLPDGVQLGRATWIRRIAATWDGFSVIYESSEGETLVLEHGWNYAAKTANLSIRNAKGDAWVAASYELPFASRTRASALAEGPEVFKLMSRELEYKTNGGKWRVTEAELVGAGRVEMAKKLRSSMPFDLLELIERNVDGAFALKDLRDVQRVLLTFLLYRPRCVQPAVATASIPDCDFDARLGFPCSDDQLAKVKEAVESKDPLETY